MSTLAYRGAREVNIILSDHFQKLKRHQNYSKMWRSEILVDTEPISDQETALIPGQPSVPLNLSIG